MLPSNVSIVQSVHVIFFNTDFNYSIEDYITDYKCC